MSTESQSKIIFSLSVVQVILSISILFMPIMYLMHPEQESLLLYGLISFGIVNLLAGLSKRIKGENRSGMFYSIAGVVLFAIGISLSIF
ncbi:hypothetical protein [Guptibacillus hwajinpoensis]|uniref:Uncharacterized protein n=2 Tax=Guptibacillus hwajinpoensis TaxID=208199 RepID=A0A0J6FXW1_9BACL|nr:MULTISPECIES: hypothetical protein [Alkalihalobacillus]KMM39177.1 hypothetical protein AB986_08105 [Alkalihalobacillus macyae]MDP4552896.1 hypothetical protein [Alkalihalobacillus macyae]MDQ0484048.1 hypothetical protein [Alkalihalobacillus hemicentroti]